MSHAQNPPTLLQRVFQLNALTSAAFGAAGLVAPSWWSRTLGIDHTAAVVLTCAGLVVFAADVAWVSSRADRAQRWAPAITAIDGVWVAASVAVLTGGWLNDKGALINVVQLVGVAALAITQAFLYRGGAHRPVSSTPGAVLH